MSSDLNLEVGLTANAGPLNTALQGGAKAVQGFSAAAEAGSKTTAAADTAATTAVNAKAEAMKKAGTVAQATGAAAKEAAKGVDAIGISARQTAAAMRMLPAQLTDVVTQLQGGANPFTVLIQQGGQVKDSFGGVMPAVRALMGLITPTVALVGSAAAAGAALALAWHQGRGEAQEYSKALILTGNAAGSTAGQLADQAREIATHVATQGKAAEALTMMAGTGAVARADLIKTARTAIELERTLGVALQDTAEKFTALGRDPLAASVKLNQGVNYLTAAIYEQIRAQLAAGNVAQAASIAQNAFADAMASRAAQVKDNLGTVEAAWKSVADWAKKGWDNMLGLGRVDTLEQSLDRVGKAIAIVRARMAMNEKAGTPNANPEDVKALVRLQMEQESFQEMARLQRRAAEKQGQDAEANQKDLLEKSAAYQAADAAIARAGASARAALVANSLAASQAEIDRFYRQDLVSAGEYQAAKLALDREAITNADKLLAAQAAARGMVQPKDQIEAKQQAADLAAIDAQRIALKEKLIKLEADEAAGLRDVAPKSRSTTMDAMRAAENAFRATQAASDRERTVAQMQAEAELVAANKAGAAAMIMNDRERGMAQIALEEEALRRRLDIQSQSAEDQKRLTEEVATWRMQREKRLTDQLKPEWQRQLEAWRDTARLMKDTMDDTFNAGLREGEAQWISLATTGRASVKSIGDAIQTEIARGAYRSFMSAASQWIGSVFGNSSGSGNFGSYVEYGGAHALGGTQERGKAYLVGEKGPEVMVQGNGGGTVIPNSALGSEISVTVINQTGTQANANVTRNSKGGIEVLLTAAEEFMAGNVAMGTGPLATAMQGRYGLKAGFGT